MTAVAAPALKIPHVRSVPRPPRPDVLRTPHLFLTFKQPLLAMRGGLSGWQTTELTTLDAGPNSDPDNHSWDWTKFRLKLLRRGFDDRIISYIYTTYETTDFWFPDVGSTFYVAARFERDADTADAFRLMEMQINLAVGREG